MFRVSPSRNQDFHGSRFTVGNCGNGTTATAERTAKKARSACVRGQLQRYGAEIGNADRELMDDVKSRASAARS
jgi:hypothetical protein